METFLRVGVITSTHGVKGELKVFPTTDDPGRFSLLKEVYLDPREDGRILHIRSVRFQNDRVLLGVDEIHTPEEGARYRQADLYIPRSEAVPLEENENYYADLIGISVFTDTGDLLGTLTEIYETGANDVYAVRLEDGTEKLLPAIRDCILSVDPAAGRMTVHLMKGL